MASGDAADAVDGLKQERTIALIEPLKAITIARMRPSHRGLYSLSIGAFGWAIVTLVSAAQGQLFATYHGRPQDWWPTLGYTAAVFSVWALLTPPVLKMADKINAAQLPRLSAAPLWVLGYPATMMLHALIFVALFWPVYGSNAPTPFAMAEPVLLANLDKSAFAYVALITIARLSRQLREQAKAEVPAETARDDHGLWVRVAGGSHRIRFDQIDWIAAAGDYAEVHIDGGSLLTDRSLASLASQLPEKEFARIHRGAIVRFDCVREVRSLGRGDAEIVLYSGQALRLSRRYRANLVAHLPV